jgi:uncharacterized protein
MTRLVVWLALIGLVFWALSTRRRPRPDSKPKAKSERMMVECVHCGLRVPGDEAVADGDRRYCSEAHRLLGPG